MSANSYMSLVCRYAAAKFDHRLSYDHTRLRNIKSKTRMLTYMLGEICFLQVIYSRLGHCHMHDAATSVLL